MIRGCFGDVSGMVRGCFGDVSGSGGMLLRMFRGSSGQRGDVSWNASLASPEWGFEGFFCFRGLWQHTSCKGGGKLLAPTVSLHSSLFLLC